MAVPKIKTVIINNGLFGYLMEAKITVEDWNGENLRSGRGHFAATGTAGVGQIYSKKWGQDLPPLPDFFLSVMHLKE